MKGNPNSQTWWFHRRLQSYIALVALIFFDLLLYNSFTDGMSLEGAGPFIWTVHTIFGGIVGAYHGLAFADDAKARALGQHPETRRDD